ncbi:MAG TPA: VOC family protein [Streptosporangiaceae bacterium]|nr:VOC family protein [Streptosporangiaceae bacterium]
MTAQLPGAAELGDEEADLADALGATFDHVAVAGRRIRDMLPLWRDTLGGRFVVGADNPAIGWRAVRLELGGVWCIELIEPLPGSTFLDGYLARRPDGGLHHVTFLVDDVQAAFERFAARGYEPFGADEQGFQMFVHPRRAGGVLLQLMRRYPQGRDRTPVMTVEDVLAGRGHNGTGLSSP